VFGGGKGGGVRVVGGVGLVRCLRGGGMIIEDDMIPYLSSRFEIPEFDIPVFEINI